MSTPLAPAIQVEQITHHYPGRTALDGVTFSVDAGEVFGLLGPNGGGKTTLFRVLATLLPLQEGAAAIGGCDVATQPDAVRRLIGVTFQSPSLDPKLTVRENLLHHGHLYGLRGTLLRDRIAGVADELAVSDRLGDLTEKLSGGLKRRVEIAKSLLHQPRVLLLDEPSTGLDPGVRFELWRTLGTLASKSGISILVTTHLMDEAERCDRLAILDRGRLVALGPPDALRSEVGGDCITIEAEQPAALRADLQARFDAPVAEVDGRLRLESERGAELVRDIMAAFPDRIRTIKLGKPTLEDVFIQKTGRPFEETAPGQ